MSLTTAIRVTIHTVCKSLLIKIRVAKPTIMNIGKRLNQARQNPTKSPITKPFKQKKSLNIHNKKLPDGYSTKVKEIGFHSISLSFILKKHSTKNT